MSPTFIDICYSDSRVMSDTEKRILAAAAGRPETRPGKWTKESIPAIDDLMGRALSDIEKAGLVETGRRGEFACLDGGVSFGGGSKVSACSSLMWA